jgi:hypothetical protein
MQLSENRSLVEPLFQAVRLTCVAVFRNIEAAMTQARHVAVLALLLVACSGEPVGRVCDLGTLKPAATEVVVASPSLDCVSRTCLRYPAQRELPPGATPPGPQEGLCTAECTSDSDCDRVPESPCLTGFTCGIAVTVGPFCCRKFCICKDYVVIPEGAKELEPPKACDPSVTENACCNLEGRQDNSAYPLCRS